MPKVPGRATTDIELNRSIAAAARTLVAAFNEAATVISGLRAQVSEEALKAGKILSSGAYIAPGGVGVAVPGQPGAGQPISDDQFDWYDDAVKELAAIVGDFYGGTSSKDESTADVLRALSRLDQ